MSDTKNENLSSTVHNNTLGLILIISAVVSMGMLYVCIRWSMVTQTLGPLTFVSCRFIVILLYLLILQLYSHYTSVPLSVEESLEISNGNYWRDLFVWGTIVGILLNALSIGIQYGEATESAGATSFVIGMYVVFVPFADMFFSGCKTFIPVRTWVSIVLVLFGMYGLAGCAETNCFSGGTVHWGFIYNVMSMMCVAGHILASAKGAHVCGATPIIIFSFTLAAILSTAFALYYELSSWIYPCEDIVSNWWIIVLTSLAEFFAMLFMTIALKIVDPTKASIVLSMESLSGAIFGYVILGEVSVLLTIIFGHFVMYFLFNSDSILDQDGGRRSDVQRRGAGGVSQAVLLLRVAEGGRGPQGLHGHRRDRGR
jgi:drug/metabolite transporter (DMT)-like permease